MNCAICKRFMDESKLERGVCFGCDYEEKELKSALRVAEILAEFDDMTKMDRVAEWASSLARQDIIERRKEDLTA